MSNYFSVDASAYQPLVNNLGLDNIKQLSATQFKDLWHSFSQSQLFHKDNPDYPCINVDASLDFYVGLLPVQVHNSSKRIVGSADLDHVLLPAHKRRSLDPQHWFASKPKSSVRNWRAQACKFVRRSHLVVYGDTPNGVDTMNAALQLAQAQRAYHVNSDTEFFTFILTDSFEQVQKIDASLCVDASFDHFEEPSKAALHQTFCSSKIDQNIWIGNEAEATSLENVFAYDIFVQYVGHQTSDVQNQSIFSTFRIDESNSSFDVESNFGNQVLEASMSGPVLIKFYDQNVVSSTAENARRIIVMAKFMRDLAMIHNKKVFGFCSTGYNSIYLLGVTLILLQKSAKEEVNYTFQSLVAEYHLIRPIHVFRSKSLLTIYRMVFGRDDFLPLELHAQVPLPSRITPQLFLGSQKDASNAKMLNHLGITHILSVGSDTDIENDFKFFKINNIEDDGCKSLWKHFDQAFLFIDDAMKNGGKVIVHCRAGVSRSATIIIGYLMSREKKSLVDAFSHVRSHRLHVVVQPNEQYMYDLTELEYQLYGFRSLSWIDLCRDLYHINARFLNPYLCDL